MKDKNTEDLSRLYAETLKTKAIEKAREHIKILHTPPTDPLGSYKCFTTMEDLLTEVFFRSRALESDWFPPRITEIDQLLVEIKICLTSPGYDLIPAGPLIRKIQQIEWQQSAWCRYASTIFVLWIGVEAVLFCLTLVSSGWFKAIFYALFLFLLILMPCVGLAWKIVDANDS